MSVSGSRGLDADIVKISGKVLSNLDRFFTFVPLGIAITHEYLRRISIEMKDSSIPLGLDRIDLRILRRLQRDGRMTNADLAKAANISPATCHRRTQRLFDDGYIRSVRADISPAKVERGALVIVGVVLDRSTQE